MQIHIVLIALMLGILSLHGLAAQDTVTIPVDYLKFMQVPLVDAELTPSDPVVAILDLTQDERGELHELFHTHRARFAELVGSEATITADDADHVALRFGPLAGGLQRWQADLDADLAGLLGGRKDLLDALRKRFIQIKGRFFPQRGDELAEMLMGDDIDADKRYVYDLQKQGSGWRVHREEIEGERSRTRERTEKRLYAIYELLYDLVRKDSR